MMKKTIAVVLMCAIAMASAFATAGITVKLSASPVMFSQEGPLFDFDECEYTFPITLDFQYELTDNLKVGLCLFYGNYIADGNPLSPVSSIYDVQSATVEYTLPVCDWFAASGKIGIGYGTAETIVGLASASATLGAKFSITDSLAVELGYSAYFGTAFKEGYSCIIHSPHLGVSYSF